MPTQEGGVTSPIDTAGPNVEPAAGAADAAHPEPEVPVTVPAEGTVPEVPAESPQPEVPPADVASVEATTAPSALLLEIKGLRSANAALKAESSSMKSLATSKANIAMRAQKELSELKLKYAGTDDAHTKLLTTYNELRDAFATLQNKVKNTPGS